MLLRYEFFFVITLKITTQIWLWIYSLTCLFLHIHFGPYLYWIKLKSKIPPTIKMSHKLMYFRKATIRNYIHVGEEMLKSLLIKKILCVPRLINYIRIVRWWIAVQVRWTITVQIIGYYEFDIHTLLRASTFTYLCDWNYHSKL